MRQPMTTLAGNGRRPGPTARLEQAFEEIRSKAGVSEQFPVEVLRAARAAAAAPELPERDETGVPFLTVDPPGSMDLDQAVHIERSGDGYRVRYAIADVPAFVAPGGVLDEEVRRRGQTIYCPDVRVPLHPELLSEGAASLLPGVVRPAYVWDIELDGEGRQRGAAVYRALVRSTRRWTYEEVQHEVDAGTAEDILVLLRDVGRLRIALESARGGASLPMPEQEVHIDDAGHYRLRRRPLLDAEDWNAQISLLTGMAAAALMLDGGVGILRTMPPAEQGAVDRLRRQASALGVQWPVAVAYGDFLRTLDRQHPRHLALIHEATALFRGAGYTAFDGDVPAQIEQAALAAPYAHVTAPLRRLVDRFGLAVCDALCRGEEVPEWARQALPQLPALMARSSALAGAVERACVDAVEAAVLQHRTGERFDAVVVDRNGDDRLVIQLVEPAVAALADGRAELGDRVNVELLAADVQDHTVRFVVA